MRPRRSRDDFYIPVPLYRATPNSKRAAGRKAGAGANAGRYAKLGEQKPAELGVVTSIWGRIGPECWSFCQVRGIISCPAWDYDQYRGGVWLGMLAVLPSWARMGLHGWLVRDSLSFGGLALGEQISAELGVVASIWGRIVRNAGRFAKFAECEPARPARPTPLNSAPPRYRGGARRWARSGGARPREAWSPPGSRRG